MLKEAISIVQSEKPSEHFIQSLLEASYQHPYSNTIHALLARSAHLNEDPRFDEFVRNAGIRSQNRAKLQHYVYQSLEPNTAVSFKNEEPRKTEPVINLTELNVDVSRPIEEPEELSETADSSAVVDPDQARVEQLERQFLTEVIASGAAYDLNEIEPIEKSSFTDSEKDQPESEEVVTESEEVETELVVNQEKESGTLDNEKHRLSEWLSILKEEAFEDSTVEETELNNDRDDNFDTSTKSKKQESSEIHQGKKSIKDAASIIDNFINNEEQIVPKRAEFFNPAKAAKSSLLDKDDIVSETLANIYAAQGNINKAISTYEKLSLLHPEKSSYFAGLIQNLKQTL